MATDLLEGENLKQTVKRRGRQAAGDLMQKAADKMNGGGLGIKGACNRKPAIRKKQQLGGSHPESIAKPRKSSSLKKIVTQLGTVYI